MIIFHFFFFFTKQTLYSKLEEKRKKKEVTLLNNEQRKRCKVNESEFEATLKKKCLQRNILLFCSSRIHVHVGIYPCCKLWGAKPVNIPSVFI